MQRKKINIGLFGFGCVGYGLYEVLQKTQGLSANISRICVKQADKARPIPLSHFTLDKNALLNDPEINTIVELIDDADAAFEIVSEALKKGKAVVSANKKMIAEHFTELLELQQTYGAPFLYEAACCASIPIIRNLEEYYDNDLLTYVEGIVNGSTNYILTQTRTHNLSFDAALQEAQAKGYAESDPTLDIGGYDAKYKLLILLAHAFGIVTQPEAIFQIGIQDLSPTVFRYAKEKNLKVKLIAQAFKLENEQVCAFVLPKFVHSEDSLYFVDDVFNGVKLQSAFADNQFFVGKGAGAFPTASAVLSDLSALGYHYQYEYKKHLRGTHITLSDAIALRVFIAADKDVISAFEPDFYTIEERYENASEAYLIGTISLENLRQLTSNTPSNPAIVLLEVLTHPPVAHTQAVPATEKVLSF